MEFKFDAENNEGLLSLQGEITIENAEQFRTVLFDSLQSCNELIVDIKEVVKGDLSFMQLLFSACMTSNRLNKKFSVHGRDTIFFKQLLKDTGFDQGIKCQKNG